MPPAPATTTTATRRSGLVSLALGLCAALIGVAAAPPAGAQRDPTVAPITVVSADGRSGTDGTRTLVLSQASNLDPAGATMSVAGSGYTEAKGIYVALCVIPPVNYVPSPCGGGVDTEGTQGAAQWISSNPPSYGVGLAQPYQPGGGFQTSFTVRAEVSPGIDCRQVRCAIVTRSDHARTSDRSQDIIVPVSFRTAPVATPPPAPAPEPGPGVPAPPAPGATPTTTAPVVTVPPLANPTTTVPAPVSTLAADGRSVSDGVRTLAVTQATELDPVTQAITVTGQGFDEGRGVYVSLCAVSADGAAPGPCRTGSPDANRWVSSNPPEYGVGVATPFEPGGSFTVELSVEAVVDTATDCRNVACAIVTRADDTNPEDRTLDLVIPVTFAATSSTTTAPSTTAPDTEGGVADDETENAAAVVIDDSTSSAGPIVAVGAVAGVLALAAAGFVVTRRRSLVAADPEVTPTSTPTSTSTSAAASTSTPRATEPPDATGPAEGATP